MKKWYKSRELWVLFIAVLLAITRYLGLDLPNLLEEARTIYISVSPAIALLIRVFFTKDKIVI